MITKFFKRPWLCGLLGFFAMIIIFIGFVIFSGCRNDASDIHTEYFFEKNARGNYTLMEAAIPADYGDFADYDGNEFPLVVVAHGFTGSIDSGGAKELIRRLASAGIAAVRVDFDGYLKPEIADDENNRACEYTLKDMEDDMTLAVKHMLANYPIDENRLGVYGRSMGGRVAMMLANESYGGYEYKAMALVAPAGNETAMISFMGGLQPWEEMKEKAADEGFVQYKQLRLRPEWFTQFEEYNPCQYGDKFKNKPVLVICNTLDYVVTDETSKECADAYANSKLITVTTENAHGYEMSYESSELKDYLMDSIVAHFKDNL